MLPFWRPDGVPSVSELRLDGPGRPSRRWHNAKPTAAVLAFPTQRQKSSREIVGNPLAIRRELRKVADFSDQSTLVASERWHDVDPSSVPVRLKDTPASVTRKRSLPVIRTT